MKGVKRLEAANGQSREPGRADSQRHHPARASCITSTTTQTLLLTITIMFTSIAARRVPAFRTAARRTYSAGRSEGSVAESKGFRCVVSALRLIGWLTVL